MLHLLPGKTSEPTCGDLSLQMADERHTQKGEEHHRAKLTEEDVHRIRLSYNTNEKTMEELAGEYGIARTTVSCIVLGRTWRHLDNPVAAGTGLRRRAEKNRGSSNGMATLTHAQVENVKTLYQSGDVSQSALARQFCVSQSTIWRIVRGKRCD